MDLEQFKNLTLHMLKILRYVLERKIFLASDIKSHFNLPNTTVYRYLNSWVQIAYLEQEINKQENKNGAHYIYRITPELEQYFKNLSKDLEKLIYMDKNK
jgi:predicted transcriptional regulator